MPVMHDMIGGDSMSTENSQQKQRRNARLNQIALITMGAGIVILAATAVYFTLSLGDGPKYSGPETATAFGNVFVDDLTPPPSPVPEATPPSTAAIERIRIPKFDVDAPVIVLGLDEDNVMESPEEPCDAGWYDFTSRPGFGSNAVFSGHVDWFNLGSTGCKCEKAGGCGGPGPAVFWNLKDLAMGDLVEVRLQDGTVYEYRVTARTQVDPDTADIQSIVGPTEREVITIITCGGEFDYEDRHYTERVIVRAERVLDESGVVAPGASTAP